MNNPVLIKAKKLSGIESDKLVIEKALQLFITIENQKQLIGLWGNVKLDDEAFK